MEKKLEFTDRAKNQIKKVTKSEDKKYFRISVQGGGCSGFKYNFSFDNQVEKGDILIDQTVIDEASLKIIAGLNCLIFFAKLLSGSKIFTLYPFFFNSFATCKPVSRLINLSFEIPPDSISIFFFNLF